MYFPVSVTLYLTVKCNFTSVCIRGLVFHCILLYCVVLLLYAISAVLYSIILYCIVLFLHVSLVKDCTLQYSFTYTLQRSCNVPV